MSNNADDAMRSAREQYRTAELTKGQEALASIALAEAEQLARIADTLSEVLALARVALTPTPPEPACTVNVAHLEQGSPCPSCGHTGYAHAPMNAGTACAICLGLGRTAPQDDETLPAPPPPGKAWAATLLTGLCHLPPFDDLSTDGPHGCSSCGHPAEQHRAGGACRGCLDTAAPGYRPPPIVPPDVDVFRPASFVPAPDPAGQWLRDNAAQVIAALRAHADVFEDEASRGMYGSAEGEERAYALAQGQRARAITVRQVTSEPRL